MCDLTHFLEIAAVNHDSESVCTGPHDWLSVTVFTFDGK
jgi:hypothetical protein